LFSLVDKPQKWDEIEDESDLIERKQFLEFILIPHIAASLIAQDLNINLQAAVEVLIESGDYGHNVNSNVPALPKGPSHPPRHRKSVNLKVSCSQFCCKPHYSHCRNRRRGEKFLFWDISEEFPITQWVLKGLT
jgi:hypothetical protein